MLYTNTVPPKALELLKDLMVIPALDGFALAGGTALSLRLGHRISVDLDLFTPTEFDSVLLAQEIQKYKDLQQVRLVPNTMNAFVNEVKIDCISHRYHQIEPIETVNTLRLYSLRDIAAMKLSAIGGRGARKDFYDIAALMSLMQLSEMLKCFDKKYPNADTFHTIRSLSYFEDADNEDEIILSETTPQNLRSWESVKDIIVRNMRNV